MVKHMCSIYDVKAEAWLMPMFFLSKGQAVRSFSDAVNGDSEFSRHPEDYTLFLVAQFDERTGEVIPVNPEPLALAVNLKDGVDSGASKTSA